MRSWPTGRFAFAMTFDFDAEEGAIADDPTNAGVEEVRSIWEHEVLGIRELGGAAVLTCHPEIIGRPSRIGFLEAFLTWVQGLGDAWIATTDQIAGHCFEAGSLR